VGSSNKKTTFAPGTREHFFALSELNSRPGRKLKRFKKAGGKNASLVTSITLHGGEVSVGEISHYEWDLADGSEPSFASPRFLSIGFTWTTVAESTTIVVRHASGQPSTVTLDSTRTEAWIANSDTPNALAGELNRQELGAKMGDVDIDFRWVYRLFDPRDVPGVKTWKEWTTGAALPAPRLVAVGPNAQVYQPKIVETASGLPFGYLVSTCFPAIWDE
jgi:hypothetical protein